jgi:hypothetical protein
MGDVNMDEMVGRTSSAPVDTLSPDAIKTAIQSVAHLFPDAGHQSKVNELLQLPNDQLMGFLKTVCNAMPEEQLQHALAATIPQTATVEERNQMYHSACQVFAQLKS